MRSVIGRVSAVAAALVAAALLALPQQTSAQSLGEAAEKAKKERKGGPKTKVITDTDLRQAGAPECCDPTPAGRPRFERGRDGLADLAYWECGFCS